MILCSLLQTELEIPLAIFENLAEAKDFLKQIPGVEFIEEDIDGYTYRYEILKPQALGDYHEISYQGNRIPLSRHMFDSSQAVDIMWQEIPNLSQPDQGLVAGTTRVDAYMVDNTEVKDYITGRELGYRRISQLLQSRGYQAGRDFAGSEDGEAIVYRRADSKHEQILVYLDPDFIAIAQLPDDELAKWLDEQLGAQTV